MLLQNVVLLAMITFFWNVVVLVKVAPANCTLLQKLALLCTVRFVIVVLLLRVVGPYISVWLQNVAGPDDRRPFCKLTLLQKYA